MTDPRCLSEAALAAIGARSEANPPRGLGDYAFLAERDRRALRDHATYLAERLAEATDASTFAATYNALQESNRELREMREELARERADHAATVTELRTAQTLSDNRQEWIDGYLKKQGYESDLATEKAARLAAEAGAVELRAALMTAHLNCGCEDGIRHKYDDDGSPIEVRCLQCAPILAALAATPSHEAAAVLAVTIEMDDATEAGDLERIAELSPKWITAVKAWRAAREGDSR